MKGSSKKWSNNKMTLFKTQKKFIGYFSKSNINQCEKYQYHIEQNDINYFNKLQQLKAAFSTGSNYPGN